MADRSRRTFDKNNYENWTASQLREALKEMGITAPSSFTKTVLKSLYKENHKPSNDVDQIQRERSRSPIREWSRSPVSAYRAANPTGPAYNITMAPTSSPVEGAGFGECLATLN